MRLSLYSALSLMAITVFQQASALKIQDDEAASVLAEVDDLEVANAALDHTELSLFPQKSKKKSKTSSSSKKKNKKKASSSKKSGKPDCKKSKEAMVNSLRQGIIDLSKAKLAGKKGLDQYQPIIQKYIAEAES